MRDVPTQALLTKRLIGLAWFTIFYNIVEGFICTYFGYFNHSTLLFSFGVDSFLETMSATLILIRFNQTFERGQSIELVQERKANTVVGWTYIITGISAICAALYFLWNEIAPAQEIHGLVISAISMGIMFYIWQAKDDLAVALNNSMAKNDAYCALACIKITFLLFLGNLIYFLMPELWFVDGAATIGLGAMLGIEGYETLRLTQNQWVGELGERKPF